MSIPQMKLSQKTAIVTGAGGSIGRAIALKLAAEGAAVAPVDIDLETARQTADAIRAAGGQAMAVAVDLRNREEIRSMAAGVLEEFGQIDILVNSVGGSAREDNALFHKSREEVIDWVLDVNLKGPLFCIRAVIEHMIERRTGKIVNIGSIVGVQGLECLVDYSAAKGGIIAMTKSLAKEVAPYGINVNCVSPGVVPRGTPSEADMRKSYLGRACTPDEVAELVLFLTTSSADAIVGQNYIIDGGRSLGMKGS
jgi:NAD(P)-dependent dehydrogenase (short-subunit alcohol dehydrogenase family)